MTGASWERLIGWERAFDEPVVAIVGAAIAGVLLLAPVAFFVINSMVRLEAELKKDLARRYISWLVMVPVVTVPVLLGAAWWFGLVTILSLLCFGEYARALGFFREKLMSLMVVIGILLVSFAILDHWYPLFVALSSLVVSAMAAVAILRDEPKGYIQRVALAVFGFILFGVCLGHLGYIGNAARYRSAVVVLLFCVQMNDVFAFLCGKAIGGPQLAPRTSPSKTIAGSVGALILTTALFSFLARVAFQGTAVGSIVHGIALGCIVSTTGQFGDLAISSLKRDIGIKDTGSLIPGHGGVLDRANSLLFASPAFFHYIDYFQPDWLDPAIRILSGGN